MTSIVNVKVSYIRPQYNNLQEWMTNPNNIYIGRKGCVFINGNRYPEKDSIWHNPFKINTYESRELVLKKYRIYITNKIKDENLYDELMKLDGKTLGCWCKPEGCHGDILIELINDLKNK